MKPFNCALFLQSIKYSGNNIGDDLAFSIRVFSTTETFKLQLKNKKQKQFDPLKLIAEKEVDGSKDSIRFLLRIDITEEDHVWDDEGSKREYHTFSIDLNKKVAFEQTVVVTELFNRILLKAEFTFSFELLFSDKEPGVIDNRNFPRLSAPVPLTKRYDSTAYLDLSNCDRECLNTCDGSQSVGGCINNGKINLRCVRIYNSISCVDNCCLK